MKVEIYVMNRGTSSQYYGLRNAEDKTPLRAPNNWKTPNGAYKWAQKHGFQVIATVI